MWCTKDVDDYLEMWKTKLLNKLLLFNSAVFEICIKYGLTKIKVLLYPTLFSYRWPCSWPKCMWPYFFQMSLLIKTLCKFVRFAIPCFSFLLKFYLFTNFFSTGIIKECNYKEDTWTSAPPQSQLLKKGQLLELRTGISVRMSPFCLKSPLVEGAADMKPALTTL